MAELAHEKHQETHEGREDRDGLVRLLLEVARLEREDQDEIEGRVSDRLGDGSGSGDSNSG